MKKPTLLAASSAVALMLSMGLTTAAYAAPTVYFGIDTATAGGANAIGGDALAERQAFLSRLQGVSSEGFEGFEPAAGEDYPIAIPDTGLALSFAGGLDATLKGKGGIYDTNALGRFNTTSGGNNLLEVNEEQTFSIEFAAADQVSAFGFYGTDIGDFGGTLLLSVYDVDGLVFTRSIVANNPANQTQLTTPDGSALFWGFIDEDMTRAYTMVTFEQVGGQGDYFGFDDMVVGSRSQIVDPPNPTPEPGSLALVGLSLLALTASRRRRG